METLTLLAILYVLNVLVAMGVSIVVRQPWEPINLAQSASRWHPADSWCRVRRGDCHHCGGGVGSHSLARILCGDAGGRCLRK